MIRLARCDNDQASVDEIIKPSPLQKIETWFPGRMSGWARWALTHGGIQLQAFFTAGSFYDPHGAHAGLLVGLPNPLCQLFQVGFVLHACRWCVGWGFSLGRRSSLTLVRGLVLCRRFQVGMTGERLPLPPALPSTPRPLSSHLPPPPSLPLPLRLTFPKTMPPPPSKGVQESCWNELWRTSLRTSILFQRKLNPALYYTSTGIWSQPGFNSYCVKSLGPRDVN